MISHWSLRKNLSQKVNDWWFRIAKFHIFCAQNSKIYDSSYILCFLVLSKHSNHRLSPDGQKLRIFWSIFTLRARHFLVSDIGGGGSNQKMTKCDMDGRESQKKDFRSDILFAWDVGRLGRRVASNAHMNYDLYTCSIWTG